MTERTRRTGASRTAAAKSSLAELLALRKSGQKRAATFEIQEEETLFDVVEEKEYKDIVKRRRDEGLFVVDDDGLGYADIGEEEDWTTAQAGSDEEAAEPEDKKRKASPKEKKEVRVKRRPEVVPGEARRLHGMFAAAARAGPIKPPSKDTSASDDLLEDILGDLGPDEMDEQHAALAPAQPFVFSRHAPRPVAPPAAPECDDHRVQGPPPMESEEAQDPAASDTRRGGLATPGSFPRRDARRVSFSADIPPPSPEHKSEGGENKLKRKTEHEEEVSDAPKPQPTPSTTSTTSTTPKATKPSGWQALCDQECAEETSASPPDTAPAAGLPLDDDNNLPFFFLDAFEQPHESNGTVYLFGKIPVGNNQFQSACCVVNDLTQCVYAVPKDPSLFADMDGELARLEEQAAAGDEESKMALLRHLQARAAPVKEELRDALLDRGVSSFSMVPVKRSYGFEREDVHRGEQYVVKVRFPAAMPQLPSDLEGRTFKALFGTQTSPLEALILKRKLMGPSWILIKSPQAVSAQRSWCKTEVQVSGHKAVGVPPTQRDAPPLTVVALNLKTLVNQRDKVNEIAAASVLYCREVRADGPMSQSEWNTSQQMRHFSVVRKLDGSVFPVGWDEVVKQENDKPVAKRNQGLVLSSQSSERALLNFLLARLHQIDADVLVGHNIGGFDLDVLLHRLHANKVPNWSRLGRLRRNKMPNLGGGGNKFGGGAGSAALSTLAGRLLCDTYLSAREFVREVSYTLANLAETQLKMQRKEFDAEQVPAMYSSSESLLGLVKHAEEDAWLSLALMFHLSVLPLTRQLTCLSGSLWNKTLQGARAQRIEYLLLHEFHARKYLLPDKLSFKEKERLGQKVGVGMDQEPLMNEQGMEGGRNGKGKGPSYAGGLVLEPKKGLYDKMVLLLDFNSLYPSIIQEYNICFTTVQRPQEDSVPPLPENVSQQAVLPAILRKLVQRRKQVKDILKTERDVTKKQQLDIRQQALKLTANSMYGCLGFNNSRFFAKPLAQLVTSQGREILQSTADLVENNLGLDVIYGDTDSIMINTNLLDIQKARQIGSLVKKEVNKKYRLLELELDYIFRTILLLKKKKYAALKIENVKENGEYTTSMECKGLDIVRRDWCPLSKDLGNNCLKEILSGVSAEEVVDNIHTMLRDAKEKIDAGEVEPEKLVITKQLTKRPADYPDASNQPHVQVALRRIQMGKREGVSAGETVPYVICLDTTQDTQDSSHSTKGIAQRAYHPEEVTGNIVPDFKYYLAHQVHPVVSRLCAPMEGTSAGQIADCLGLDPSKFHAQTSRDSASAREDALLGGGASLDDEDRYKLCEPLILQCPKCAEKFPFKGVSQLLHLGSNSCDKALTCPTCMAANVADGTVVNDDAGMVTPVKDRTQASAPGMLTGPMLANQVKLRLNEFVAKYYDGWLRCDEACECRTRCICTKAQGDAAPGTLSANHPQCTGRVSRAFTEADLYKQLSHFVRLLDVNSALAKVTNQEKQMSGERALAPFRMALQQGMSAAERVRDRAAFKWVRLDALCGAA